MLILYELVASHKIIGAIALIVISAVSVYYYIRMIKVVYFEPSKETTKTSSEFTVVFLNKELDRIYFLFVVLLFIVGILFYFPTLLLTVCQYIVIHSFGF
jgi:NADH:ubiquinone oxidoreductase subunit 2 (subunit N)